MSDIELIKNRVKISDLISKYVSLKPKGNGEFVAICPFHNEKTPSFTVSEHKGFFHCFGCGENGDIFTFLMKIERLEYIDALKQLAQTAGVVLKTQSKQTLDLIAITQQIYKAAQSYYQNQLTLNTPSSKSAFAYLKNRGFSVGLIQKFGLGYSPSYEGLPKYLLSKFTEAQLLQAKAIYKKSSYFDMFAGRVIFPIHDRKGNVIAFGGRVLTAKSDQPKYLNSPENPIFHKSFNLYGLFQASKSIISSQEAIVVEGYVDVLSLHQAGVYNAVAPLGTSLKLEHINTLAKLSNSIIVCLDGDDAGKKAMVRTIELILPEATPNTQVKFVSLPLKYDPDDYIKKHGVDALKQYFKKAQSIADFMFDHLKNNHDLSTPEGKTLFKSALVKIACKIKNPYLQQEYKYHFNDKFWQETKFKNKKSLKVKAQIDIKKATAFEQLLALIIAKPQLLKQSKVTQLLIDIDISNKVVDNLRCALLEWRDCSEHKQPSHSYAELKTYLNDRNIDINYFEFFINRFNSSSLEVEAIADKLIHKHQLGIVSNEIDMLKNKLKHDVNENDLTRYNSLINVRNQLKKAEV